MKFIKKYESFTEELVSGPEPATKPATRPSTTPSTKPGTKPGRRPSPIRRDKPAVDPAPKAEKEGKLPKATIEDVIEKYAELTNQNI